MTASGDLAHSVVLATTNIPNFGGSSSTCVADNKLFCWNWVQDNWGSTLWPALRQHIVLSLIALAVGFIVAVGLALLAHRRRWLETPVTVITGIMFTIPSLALFQILVPATGLSRLTAEVALVSYTLLILFRNTLIGLRGVPDDVRESARGMGYTDGQMLWRVELPLALPAIIAGLRIAAVTVISLATVAVYVDNEGLGAPILTAIQKGLFKTEVVAAGLLAFLLALTADGILVLIQRALTPWARSARRA